MFIELLACTIQDFEAVVSVKAKAGIPQDKTKYSEVCKYTLINVEEIVSVAPVRRKSNNDEEIHYVKMKNGECYHTLTTYDYIKGCFCNSKLFLENLL